LDGPGILHHATGQGIDRRAIIEGEADRDGFVP